MNYSIRQERVICKDPRNTGIVKLVEEEIKERDFPDWSMGFKNLKDCSPDELPGFTDIFNGNLDKELVSKNSSKTLGLLINFSKMSN